MVPLQQQVAGGFNGAMTGTQQAMNMNLGMRPMMAQTSYASANPATTTMGTAQGYNAFTGMGPGGQPMSGYGPGRASGFGYAPTSMSAARDVTAGQISGTNLDAYMNPYQNQVIDQTLADMERARLIEQNATNDAMTAAGAFGGSRHGIANAETNRNYYGRVGSTTGQLRNLGFQNAQAAAFQDIGNRMNADLANQQSDLTRGAFNANAANTAAATGANNRTQASVTNANADTQLASQRLAAMNDARRFGADARNNMSMFNAGQANGTSRFNSSLGADLSRFNAGETNATSRINAGAANTMQQNKFNNQMNASSQLGNLSNLGFGMANTISNQQAQDGAQVQALEQAIINAAKQQYGGYTGAGNLGLGMLQSGLGATPGGAGTTTSTSNPGLGGLLSMFL